MPIINILTEFIADPDSRVQSQALHTHVVSRGRLQGSPKTWICKEVQNPAEARIEILAQEIFRLIIPHQPETRLALNQTTGVYYILSEESKGYRPLPKGNAKKFADGEFTGLGQAMVTALFVQEIDLKNGNIGLDEANRVIKIDGDRCFSSISPQYKRDNFKLTTDVIERLPYPHPEYTCFNWLDLTKQSMLNPNSSKIVDMTLIDSPQFKAESNQAMLKICLLPDLVIDRLVNSYFPAGGERFADLLKARRAELRHTATYIDSFKAYIQSPNLDLDAEHVLTQITAMQVNGEAPLIPADQHDQLKQQIWENMVGFKRINLRTLVNQIEKYPVNNNDELLNQYITNTRQRIMRADQPATILQIESELNQVLTSVSSPQVKAVQQTIETLRHRGFFAIGNKDKALRISQALANTPLNERGTVISGNFNPVQAALASHRHFFRESVDTNLENAAQSLKDLQAQFPRVHQS